MGSHEEGVSGRATQTQEHRGDRGRGERAGIGRIRFRRVLDVSAASLIPFAEEVLRTGSEVYTDGRAGYNGL